MRVIRFNLGQLQTNCYLLIKENQGLVIDPADEANFILEEVSRRRLNLVGLLATHGHFDHIGAVGEIQKTLKIFLYLSKKDIFLVDRLNETAAYFLGYDPHFLKPSFVNYLTQSEFKIKNFKFKIIFTPGHTPGGLSFYFPEDKIVFTGDTLFKQGIGRYDFSYSNKKDLLNSVKAILTLPAETLIYSGHGEETKVGDEQKLLASI